MVDWVSAHWVEVFGFVTGIGCVLLAARRNIANFPVGILSSLVFFVVFVEHQLYADAGLQIVFVILGITGWAGWSRGRAVDDRAATRLTPHGAVLPLAAAGVAATALLTAALILFTDSTTEVPDAATTAGSLIAQFMMNKRWIESWFVWIAVDVAYIGLYFYKGLWITAVLYLVFIGVCLLGLRTWRAAPHLVVARAEQAGA